jgi:hypothetical protein
MLKVNWPDLANGSSAFVKTSCDHFRRQTRTLKTTVRHYLCGLLQAEIKNMEQMEEVIPEAAHQALPAHAE